MKMEKKQIDFFIASNRYSSVSHSRITTMHSTDVRFRINMGMLGDFHKGLPGDKLGTDKALQNFDHLKRHMDDILPTPDDLDHLDDAPHIIRASLKNLEIGKVDEFGLYNIEFIVTIQHDVPVQPKTIQEIAEITFDHGANSPITVDELPNYFLYPYESIRIG